MNVIKQLALKASCGGVLAHQFVDAVYGRTGFFLIGDNLIDRSLSLCQEAFKLISYDSIQGTHPCLGVVDHVCFSPIGDAELTDTAEIAKTFSERLYSLEKVPVYNYAAASINGLALKDIRRELGYFQQGSMMDNMRQSKQPPDFGDMSLDLNPSKGIMCVGAIKYLQNFNMRFRVNDSKKDVMQITKYVRDSDVSY